MKKTIRFQFEGKKYTVEVEREGNELIIEREGETYRVTLLPEEKPAGLAEKPAEILQPQAVAPPPPPTAQPMAKQPASPPQQAEAGKGVLTAPITGVIKEIKIAQGQRVQKGQVIIVMEAMKMDIDLYAPVSGIVQEVFVHQGQNVKANEILLRIE